MDHDAASVAAAHLAGLQREQRRLAARQEDLEQLIEMLESVTSLKPDAAARLVAYRHTLERLVLEASLLDWEIRRLRRSAEAA